MVILDSLKAAIESNHSAARNWRRHADPDPHTRPSEAAPYYFKYIDRVEGDDIVVRLESQLDETLAFLAGVSEARSLHRYQPGKWSIREVLSHLSDVERVSLHRALWFARGFESPLPSYEQDLSVAAAKADQFPWASHVEEFRHVRLATLSFFRNLPAEAWMRSGVASDNRFTVRALAYLMAGHVTHHVAIIKERYLS